MEDQQDQLLCGGQEGHSVYGNHNKSSLGQFLDDPRKLFNYQGRILCSENFNSQPVSSLRLLYDSCKNYATTTTSGDGPDKHFIAQFPYRKNPSFAKLNNSPADKPCQHAAGLSQ